MRLNHVHVIPGRGCVCGVVGFNFPGLPAGCAMSMLLAEVVWDDLP